MNVEWTERKLDSLTGHKTRATQYQFNMFSPLYFVLSHELFISDQSILFYLSNDKSSDDELVKIRIEVEGKGGEGSLLSHRQWLVGSNHTRPISLPFKRFRSSLQYS
jgi:hypothetical protein